MTQPNIEPKLFLNRNYTNLLRGVCMVMIVYGHTANEFTEVLAKYHLGFLLESGRFATGVFLFLSGYGLTLSIKRNIIDGSYIRRHLQKLLLPYFTFWMFYFLIGFLCGFPSTQNNICIDFIFLKMPNVDTWFFRTILVLYVLYFSLARYLKTYAGIGIAVIIFAYITILIYYEVSSWWWNTIMCFPVGILYANFPALCRKMPFVYLVGLGALFVFLHKFLPVYHIGAICAPIILCLICAYLSTIFFVPYKVPILTFIGINSLYMYFMETIPIDYLNSAEVGFAIYISGGIGITIALTYLGKFIETYVKKCFTHWQN